MRSELRVSPHTLLAGVKCVEIWYDNRIIGVIYPADFGGVRIISKHFDNRQSPHRRKPTLIRRSRQPSRFGSSRPFCPSCRQALLGAG